MKILRFVSLFLALSIFLIPFISYYQDTMQELTEIHDSNNNALNWESVSRMELTDRLINPTKY